MESKEEIIAKLTKTIDESTLSRLEMSKIIAEFFLAIEKFNLDVGFVTEVEFLKKL